MSRRDTILMAVLINAGLLIILFATAIAPDDRPNLARSSSKVDSPASQMRVGQIHHPDEIDRVLSRYTAAQTTPMEEANQALDRLNGSTSGTPTVFPSGPHVEEIAFSSQPSWVEVTVKKGDSLDRIARANGTSIQAIQDINVLDTTRLQIGQTLRVPVATEKVVERAPVNEANHYYTIEDGDSPWKVAMKLHIPLDELLALNGLDEEGARKLRPGNKIRIR